MFGLRYNDTHTLSHNGNKKQSKPYTSLGIALKMLNA